jgi:spore maturation protein SpmA
MSTGIVAGSNMAENAEAFFLASCYVGQTIGCIDTASVDTIPTATFNGRCGAGSTATTTKFTPIITSTR